MHHNILHRLVAAGHQKADTVIEAIASNVSPYYFLVRSSA